MSARTVIQIIVTPKQKRAITHAAKQAGMSVSGWLRWLAHVEGRGK